MLPENWEHVSLYLYGACCLRQLPADQHHARGSIAQRGRRSAAHPIPHYITARLGAPSGRSNPQVFLCHTGSERQPHPGWPIPRPPHGRALSRLRRIGALYASITRRQRSGTPRHAAMSVSSQGGSMVTLVWPCIRRRRDLIAPRFTGTYPPNSPMRHTARWGWWAMCICMRPRGPTPVVRTLRS